LFTLAFLCVLLHEYGHIFAAKCYGINCQKIILTPIGGIAVLDHDDSAKNYKPLRDFIIASAGPMVNVLIMALTFLANIIIYCFVRHLDHFLSTLFMINAVMFLFNLLPAYPMDGGRMYKAILSIFFNY